MVWEKLQVTEEEMDLVRDKYKKRAKFLADENFNASIVGFLREDGLNIKDVYEFNLKGKSDEAVYAYAYKIKRIILTHDTDFLNHRNFPFHNCPGVLYFLVVMEILCHWQFQFN